MSRLSRRLDAIAGRIDPKAPPVVIHCFPGDTPEAAEARHIAEHGPVDRGALAIILHTFTSPI